MRIALKALSLGIGGYIIGLVIDVVRHAKPGYTTGIQFMAVLPIAFGALVFALALVWLLKPTFYSARSSDTMNRRK